MRSGVMVMTVAMIAGGAAASLADVTIVSENTGEGMAKMADGPSTVYVKGDKMRSEQGTGKKRQVMILDASTNTMTVLNEKKKRAEVYDLSAMAQEMQSVGAESMTASVSKGEGGATIAGHACENFDMKIEVTMAGMDGNPLTTLVSGPVCLSSSAPGQEEVAAFYSSAVEKGLFFMPPEAAEAQPGQAKGFAEMYRAMAEHGVALSNQLTVGFEGSGMMAAIFEKMKFTTTSTVTSISTTALSDDLFEVPAGYKVKQGGS